MLSSLRNFILALFFSLLVFGTGAYFLVGYVTGFINDVIDPEIPDSSEIDLNPEESTSDDSTDDTTSGRPPQLTVLIMGLDNGESQLNEKREADSIYLVDINADTQRLVISSIPCDTRVTVKGYILRLGMVMAEYGIETMMDTIKSYTGIMPDYYFAFGYESIVEMMNLFGEVTFDVPMDMYYMPEIWPPIVVDEESEEVIEIEEQKPEIDLKQGKQPIDGEKAVQIFRYKDYSNGNIGRMATQRDFVMSFINQKITLEYFGEIRTIYNSLKESVSTNMKETDLLKYTDLIFSVSKYEIVEVEYPGQMVLENGALFYSPSVSTAIKRYKEYRRNAS